MRGVAVLTVRGAAFPPPPLPGVGGLLPTCNGDSWEPVRAERRSEPGDVEVELGLTGAFVVIEGDAEYVTALIVNGGGAVFRPGDEGPSGAKGDNCSGITDRVLSNAEGVESDFSASRHRMESAIRLRSTSRAASHSSTRCWISPSWMSVAAALIEGLKG